MAPKSRHRTPIIEAAVSLFRRQGYAGTGLNDIVDASGAPKGSIYHYFPKGKPSIAVAAIEEANRRAVETLENLSKRTTSTGELINAHVALLISWMRKSGFQDGCPMSTVLLELAPHDRLVTEAGRKAYAARNAVLTARLVEDGFDHARATRLATLCTSTIQGALIQSRVERSGAPLTDAVGELDRLLTAARQEQGKAP